MEKDRHSDGWLYVLGFLGICWMLSTCGAEGAGRGSFEQDYSAIAEETLREDVAADLASQTYEDVRGSFNCTEDCSGHDAGWEWAANNSVTDPSDCSGTASFAEGCEAFAEELQDRAF